MQIGPVAMKWQSMITKKTEDEKVVVYHNSASDGGALAMTCGKDEEPWPSVTTRGRIDVLVHIRAMDTCCR